jgi:hypothetical protein
MIDQLKATLLEEVEGLDERQASQAAATAVAFLEDRLPAPIADRLDELVDGDGRGDLDVGQLGGVLKGFLGR